MFHNGSVIASRPVCSLLESSLRFVGPNDDVLDIGAGFGRVGSALEAVNPTAKITSLEVSPDLVLRGIHTAKSLNFVQGDINDIPFPGESFDAVTAVNVFHEVANNSDPDKRLEEFGAAAKEVSRVLRVGGRLIMFDGVMPAGGTKNVLVYSRSSTAEELLNRFVAEYSARKPDIKFYGSGYARIDVSTLVTLLTKFGYLSQGKAWEGERQQLYPFSTLPEIRRVLSENGLTTERVEIPDPKSRPGLGLLLDNYTFRNLDTGAMLGFDNFPSCQALIRAVKLHR